MKITAIEAVPVRVPRRVLHGDAFRTSLGSARVSEYVVVIVTTDEGLTGLGEASSVFARRGTMLHLEIESLLAPVLLGADPARISEAVARMNAALDGAEPAKAALEMALWDIKGKALGTPVYDLLGGKVRDRVALSYSIPFAPPAKAAANAEELVREGFRTVKIKVGQDLHNDVATVEAIRAAVGPGVRVRIDANMGFADTKQCLKFIDRVAQFEPEILEQPLARHDLPGMAEVRRRSSIPIMADESVWTPLDAAELVRQQAADVASIYVSEAGGLLEAWRCFALLNPAGISCLIGSMPELGIGTAAAIHLAIAMPDLPFACDACGALYHTDDLITDPLKFEGGFAYPPDKPGLGIELDRDALERYRAS